MADDPADLVLNPGVSLKVQCTIRRKDRPITTLELNDGNREMLRWLLSVMDLDVAEQPDVEVEVDEAVFEAAVAAGVFVPPEQVPGPVAPYRCTPDEATLPLVTPRDAPAPQLELNPRCYLQSGSDLPAPIRDRVLLGEQLWAHFGGEFQPDGPRAFAPGSHVLWVSQPDLDTLEPIWVPEALVEDIAGVVERRRAVASLSAQARDLLRLSNALTSPGARPHDDAGHRARLLGDGYLVLRNAVSPLTSAALRRHFRTLRNAGYFEIDTDQVVGMRDGMYCEVACLFFQHQLTYALNRILTEPVRPSYSWVRRYYPHAVLARHRDRSQCRWNISLCADLGPHPDPRPWPFYLEVNGTTHEVLLEAGDAVVYSGTDLPHWRDPLPPGQEATMCFFHYVPASFTGPLR